jgi:hypothetical protein
MGVSQPHPGWEQAVRLSRAGSDKDSRNVGLWAKKRAQDMGVDLGSSFDETVEKARTGKILDEV